MPDDVTAWPYEVGDEVIYKRNGSVGVYHARVLDKRGVPGRRRVKIKLLFHQWYRDQPVSDRPRWVKLSAVRKPGVYDGGGDAR